MRCAGSVVVESPWRRGAGGRDARCGRGDWRPVASRYVPIWPTATVEKALLPRFHLLSKRNSSPLSVGLNTDGLWGFAPPSPSVRESPTPDKRLPDRQAVVTTGRWSRDQR